MSKVDRLVEAQLKEVVSHVQVYKGMDTITRGGKDAVGGFLNTLWKSLDRKNQEIFADVLQQSIDYYIDGSI